MNCVSFTQSSMNARLSRTHNVLKSSFLCQRKLSTGRTYPSIAYTNPTTADDRATTSVPTLTASQHKCLDQALRVDQAGEIAANYIYQGQMAVLGRDKVVGPLIQVR